MFGAFTFDRGPRFWSSLLVLKFTAAVGAFTWAYSPTAESFGVSAKLGPGALWGNHEVRRFQVKVLRGAQVPRKVQVKRPVGSKDLIEVPRGSEVPSEGSKSFPKFQTKVPRGCRVLSRISLDTVWAFA